MGSIEPSPERMLAFAESEDEAAPLVMINLLRYREQADYPAGFAAEPCSGREAYARYSAGALARVASVGGRVLWLGRARASVIVPDGEEWDDVALVEYPSRKAFFEMVAQPEYQAVMPHRTAALADSRLIATTGLGGSGLG